MKKLILPILASLTLAGCVNAPSFENKSSLIPVADGYIQEDKYFHFQECLVDGFRSAASMWGHFNTRMEERASTHRITVYAGEGEETPVIFVDTNKHDLFSRAFESTNAMFINTTKERLVIERCLTRYSRNEYIQ